MAPRITALPAGLMPAHRGHGSLSLRAPGLRPMARSLWSQIRPTRPCSVSKALWSVVRSIRSEFRLGVDWPELGLQSMAVLYAWPTVLVCHPEFYYTHVM